MRAAEILLSELRELLTETTGAVERKFMDFVWYLRPWQGCVLIYDRTRVRYRRHDDGIVEERGMEETRRREKRKEGIAHGVKLQKGGWRAITLAVSRFDLTIFFLALFFCIFLRPRCRASIFRRVRNTIDTQRRVARRRYLSTTPYGRSRTSKKRARKGAYGAPGGRPMWHGDAWEIRFVIEIVTATYRRSRAQDYPELRLRISVLRRGISQLNSKFATVRRRKMHRVFCVFFLGFP